MINDDAFIDFLKMVNQKWDEIEPTIRASLKDACARSAPVELPGIVLVSATVLAEHTGDVNRLVLDHITAMKSDSRGASVINRGYGTFRSEADGIVLKTVAYRDDRLPQTFVMTHKEAALDEVEIWIEITT